MRMFICRNGIGVVLIGTLQKDTLTCNLTLNVADNYTLYTLKEDGIILKYTCNILEDLHGSYPEARYRIELTNIQETMSEFKNIIQLQ